MLLTKTLELTIGCSRAKHRALPFLLLALSGCVANGQQREPNASMGMLIARQSCAECHAIGGSGDSPNPNAPAFSAIVDRPGVAPEQLAGWLRDGHNYPIEMGFHLEPHQIGSLVEYMVRWRSQAPPPR